MGGRFGISQALVGFCSTKPLGGKAHCRWFGERLGLLLFLSDARAELSPPAKSRVRPHNTGVGLGVTASFFCSFIKKSWEFEIL